MMFYCYLVCPDSYSFFSPRRKHADFDPRLPVPPNSLEMDENEQIYH